MPISDILDIFGKKNELAAEKGTKGRIPYYQIYDNGVIETEPGVFTKAYKLQDINFKIATDDEQVTIFKGFGAFLNSFATDVQFQIVIFNKKANKADVFDSIRLKPQSDGLNKHRQEMNNLLIDKLKEGKNNLSQSKYLVVSVKDKSVEHAMDRLRTMDAQINMALEKISKNAKTRPQTMEERLRILHDIYNQDGESIFENDINEENKRYFNLDKVYKVGLDSKDVISPAGFYFKDNYMYVGNTMARTLYLDGVPNKLTTDFLSDLAALPCRMLISLQYVPMKMSKAMKMVNDKLINIEGEIARAQKQATQSGYSADITPPKLGRERESAKELLDDMAVRDQKLYTVTIVLTLFASTEKELSEQTSMITTVANNHLSPMKTLLFQQENGLNASLPLCVNRLHTDHALTTDCASVYMPFTSQEIIQPHGLYYGLNKTTNSVIVYDRLSGKNYNGIFFGESGSGKSFNAKTEMRWALLRSTKNVVYVIDPENEYAQMAETMQSIGGKVIDLSPSSRTYINPMDMDIQYGAGSDPVAMKSNYIISLIEVMMDHRELTGSGKSVVDRCVKTLYNGYLKHMEEIRSAGSTLTCDKNASPTLVDLYEELCRDGSDVAMEIAREIEIYTKGSMQTFAHRTNVDLEDSRFVVYNIKNIGTQIKDLALYVCLNDVWNNCIENRANNIYTWFYIDEFYKLLQSDSTALFLMEIWKRARKWYGVPTGIMQNTEDLLKSDVSRNIINNTEFISILSVPKIDRANLQDLLNLSDEQLNYITNNRKGHGLLYTGKTILPFNNEYPRDSVAYRDMQSSENQ